MMVNVAAALGRIRGIKDTTMLPFILGGNILPVRFQGPAQHCHAAGTLVGFLECGSLTGTPLAFRSWFIPRLKAALKANEPLGGNLVEIWSRDTLEEIQTLWSCFNCSSPFTALLLGPAKDSDGVTHTSFSPTRGHHGQKIEHVGLLQIGEAKGPWLPKAQKVQVTAAPQVQRKTVRVAAPVCFRMPWLGDSYEDSPTQLIQSLTEITSAQAADFCGGRWTVQDKPKIGKQLVAFLRLKDTLVQKLKESSGEKGFVLH